MSSSSEPVLPNNDDSNTRYPVADPALRKSCDRCYSQKLKCSKTDVSAESCARCSRAGVRCFYSTRLARQTQKRPNLPSQSPPQRLPKRVRQEPLPSPTLEGSATFDPMSLVHFELDHTRTTSSAFLPDFPSTYTWPPEEWTAAETSAFSVAVLNDAPPAMPTLLEPLSLEPSSTESETDKTQKLTSAAFVDDQQENPPRLSIAQQARPSLGPRGYSDLPPLHTGAFDRQLSIFHRKTASRQESLVSRDDASSSATLQESYLSERLHALSRQLEELHDRLAGSEPPRDLKDYAIGETLEGTRSLLTLLRQHSLQSTNPYIRNKPYDQPSLSLRTTHSFIALQCYVLCVKVLTRLCQHLLRHPHILAECEAQAIRQDRHARLTRSHTTSPVQNGDERPGDLIDEALCLPIQPDLLLGEVHLLLDSLGHTLNCICGALGAGYKLLRGIEAILGIPKSLGVSYENGAEQNDLTAHQPEIPEPAETQTRSSTITNSYMLRHLNSRYEHCNLRVQKNTEGSIEERLIAILWDEATILNSANGVYERAPLVLKRCSEQIYTLTQQHMLYTHSL